MGLWVGWSIRSNNSWVSQGKNYKGVSREGSPSRGGLVVSSRTTYQGERVGNRQFVIESRKRGNPHVA